MIRNVSGMRDKIFRGAINNSVWTNRQSRGDDGDMHDRVSPKFPLHSSQGSGTPLGGRLGGLGLGGPPDSTASKALGPMGQARMPRQTAGAEPACCTEVALAVRAMNNHPCVLSMEQPSGTIVRVIAPICCTEEPENLRPGLPLMPKSTSDHNVMNKALMSSAC